MEKSVPCLPRNGKRAFAALLRLRKKLQTVDRRMEVVVNPRRSQEIWGHSRNRYGGRGGALPGAGSEESTAPCQEPARRGGAQPGAGSEEEAAPRGWGPTRSRLGETRKWRPTRSRLGEIVDEHFVTRWTGIE